MSYLMTIDEFMNTFKVCRSTVYRLRERGDLKFVHIGRAVRIRREDAEKWYASLPCDPANDQ